MHIQDDSICKFCQSVFCCANCRHKHEITNHAIVVRKTAMVTSNASTITTKLGTKSNGQQNAYTAGSKDMADQASFEDIYLFCPICAKQPLPLQSEIYHEMLVHVETHHLPLRCEKCSKMFYNIDDLKEFTKCMRPNTLCISQGSVATNQSCITDDASKITVTKAVSSAQNSSVERQDFNDSHITPISLINMRWKAKSNKPSHEEFISDSVSSIKNISSISNSSIPRNGAVVQTAKGEIIRSTSTPVHLEMIFAKPKEQTFNATGGGHMSSIQYTSGCESETSPALAHPNSQALESINRYRKVGCARPKITAVTPLRQVMSKSIQKAFAEHGLPPASTGVRGGSVDFQRKKMFDNTGSPSLEPENARDKKHLSPGSSALDLRLSPAVRRSQSESKDSIPFSNEQAQGSDMQKTGRSIFLSAQKLTTESIVITRTEHLSSVSSSTSAISSNGSLNSVRPLNATNCSYQSVNSNSSGGSLYKSCSSVQIITATTEKIQQFQSMDSLASGTNHPLPPITPITRIPGALINKKLIKFETPTTESWDSREPNSSPVDVFFTPNSTPISEESEENGNSTEVLKRTCLAKQNLCGRFSQLQRPPLENCARSIAVNRIENLTTENFDKNYENDENDDNHDEVFLEQAKIAPAKISEPNKNPNQTQNAGGLWSMMSSVMGIPSRKGSLKKSLSKPESFSVVDPSSRSLIKRCASIAGSLVRSKPLMDESELQTLKRKRTLTMDEQASSSFLNQLNNTEIICSSSDSLNTSSKRFRIQGRRPIDRMRLNS